MFLIVTLFSRAAQARHYLEPPHHRLFRIGIPTENGDSDSVHALQVRVRALNALVTEVLAVRTTPAAWTGERRVSDLRSDIQTR